MSESKGVCAKAVHGILIHDVACYRARDVIASVMKRLAHRNANVQLYTLALAEALSKNCGLRVNREIASRSFTQALERLITDRVSLPVPSS